MIPGLNLGVNVALTTITASDRSRSVRSGCMARQPARRHDELRKGGGEALAEVQRRALLGEAVENYQAGDVDSGGKFWGTILSARPHRDTDGTIGGVLVAFQQMQAFGGEAGSQLTPDPLTGLADRQGFARRLREVL